MSQLLLDLNPAPAAETPPPTVAAPASGTTVPDEWVPTPAPSPSPGDRLIDRHGRTATVIDSREDGIDIRLDHPSNFGHSTFCGLYPPTWWRNWRTA